MAANRISYNIESCFSLRQLRAGIAHRSIVCISVVGIWEKWDRLNQYSRLRSHSHPWQPHLSCVPHPQKSIIKCLQFTLDTHAHHVPYVMTRLNVELQSQNQIITISQYHKHVLWSQGLHSHLPRAKGYITTQRLQLCFYLWYHSWVNEIKPQYKRLDVTSILKQYINGEPVYCKAILSGIREHEHI